MHSKRPKVLIVGAGLGGLALGMILQKSDTPYEIFERAPEVKPLGNKSTHNHAAMTTSETEPFIYLRNFSLSNSQALRFHCRAPLHHYLSRWGSMMNSML